MTTKSLREESIISSLDDEFDIRNCLSRVMPDSILMCEPTYFEVKDVKNPFMKGNLAAVDKSLAENQWQELKAQLEKTSVKVATVPGVSGLEDMVFTANQVLVGMWQDGAKYVVPGKMKHESRRREVPHYIQWFYNNGYEVRDFDCTVSRDEDTTTTEKDLLLFEGHGDAIWHPEKMLLWGGFGHRTSKDTYHHLTTITNAPVILLELVDTTFYHLDTCFCVLDKETVMIYPKAFNETGLKLISTYFKTVMEVDIREANNFACNALAVKENVFIQKGNPNICKKLNKQGFKTIEVDTSEFMKSGGSVFCLTLDFYG